MLVLDDHRKEISLIWAVREVEQHPPAPLLLSRISSIPLTKESAPLALEATKKRGMSRSFTDNINSFNVSNVSNHYTVADDRSEILTWFSPLEPRIRYQDLRTRRADNVGEWLLQTNEFQRWCGGAHATLLCYGDPAVGKTYLRCETILEEKVRMVVLISSDTSSLVVDRLCDEAEGRNIVVACFYVDFAAREEQSPTNMLGSLLRVPEIVKML